jgi:arylsulfatase A-like enzyme
MTAQNVLLITTDRHHHHALGIHDPILKTPHLDRLASEGMVFNRAYCPNPTCSPSRASLITGLYPAWHGCWSLGVKLPEDVPTIGEIFQKNGFESILIGKAHFQPLISAPGSDSIEAQSNVRNLDFWRHFNGPWYGFNHVETSRMHAFEPHVGGHYALWMEENGLPNWADYFQTWPPDPESKNYQLTYDSPRAMAWDLPERFHHTHWVGERTAAQIERCASSEKPFFLWASFFDPHPFYAIPEPWFSMYDPADMQVGSFRPGEMDDMPPHHQKTREISPDFTGYQEPGGNALHGFHSHLHQKADMQKAQAVYYGMISLIDAEIGRILKTLDKNGLTENTLVVFISDHGHFLGQHGLITKGAFHYEDLLRVPMIARWPSEIPKGKANDALQSLIDLPTTFLSALDLKVPGLMQGRNQLPNWHSPDQPVREHVVIENRHNPTTMHLRTFVTERSKLTVYRNTAYGELFDLAQDPEELHNRWDDPACFEIKAKLLHQFIQAELQREPTRMPRIADA